jgi:DNA-binding transcriptional ArsR family regulator
MKKEKLSNLVFKSKEIAYAIVGQSIIDEGDIGQTSITLAYYSESTAQYLWKIADRWGLANPLHEKKKRSGATVWSFTIKACKRKELYDFIGPLPDERKDFAYNHLLIPQPSGKHRYRRKEAKQIILALLRKEPMTRRELMYRLEVRGSTVARHLLELKDKGLIVETSSANRFGRRQSSKL